LEDFEWSFGALVQRGYSWFQKCVEIDARFDATLVGWVVLTPANSHERAETPQSNYYIFDGVHKTIVMAKRILTREWEYQPVEVLLLEPRRN
jgi:hypothetical protein